MKSWKDTAKLCVLLGRVEIVAEVNFKFIAYSFLFVKRGKRIVKEWSQVLQSIKMLQFFFLISNITCD